MTLGAILNHLLTMSIDQKINTAFWSIRYEMELSLVFPLLCALLLKLRTMGSVLLGAACALGGGWLARHAASAPIAEAGSTIQPDWETRASGWS